VDGRGQAPQLEVHELLGSKHNRGHYRLMSRGRKGGERGRGRGEIPYVESRRDNSKKN
jgi:hypothetical protein